MLIAHITLCPSDSVHQLFLWCQRIARMMSCGATISGQFAPPELSSSTEVRAYLAVIKPQTLAIKTPFSLWPLATTRRIGVNICLSARALVVQIFIIDLLPSMP